MSSNYQKEIPQARINITLDLETGGSRQKAELPFSLLVVGDFSHGKTTGAVGERRKINVNKDNLNMVLSDLSPELNMTVPNKIKNDGSDMLVHLKFDSMKAFNPEKIVHQVPELNKLLGMRHLLKDLRSNIIDNTQFRKELEKILQEKQTLQNFKQELGEATSPCLADGGVA